MAARHRAWWPNIDGEQHILNDAGDQADLVQELEALLLPTCPATTSVAMTAPPSPDVATVSEPIQLTAVMAPQPVATAPNASQAVEAAQMREPEEWSWQQQTFSTAAAGPHARPAPSHACQHGPASAAKLGAAALHAPAAAAAPGECGGAG
ncbi:hypothetical protein HaLaN_04659, partial [Haematococcus lacustris]